MLKIYDEAIVLTTRKHGETSVLLVVLTQNHGVYHGMVRGAASKQNRGLYHAGNKLAVEWGARIPEHLGSLKGEMVKANAAHIMQNANATAALNSACSLLATSLPERHPYPNLYAALDHLIESLTLPSDAWLWNYVEFEMLLLAETGFGLDLSECAATGQTHDLVYVSPKSGRAVSREAGEPYKEKMLRLPQELLTQALPLDRTTSKALPLEGGGLGGGDILVERSRTLRKNLTDAEKKLWHHLRYHQLENLKFRRQHPMGNQYIVDFVCLEKKVIIKLDGGQHAEQEAYDTKRTAFLEAEGYRVLRFWNHEVLQNIEGVWDRIHETLVMSPPPQPSPLKGKGDLYLSPPSRGRALIDALTLTGFFLEHRLFEHSHKKMPIARSRLLETLANRAV